ncbi:DedA family protein [Actinomadura rupiterrae]|uniref:DedA family protein n=1 Tax=Actinomadura rupiterrae TaxID=559627 RepID=UPI0020A4058C|nr:DedA family protein [Actinomadura rupiterrae]MCP2339526.1 membrane protein DedA with SNARE-associated domain [Actinomadura rupiterrae]
MMETTGWTVVAAAGGGDAGGVTGWATDLMERLGAPGAGIAIALENLFPPLPSEVILPLAGFTAARGEMSLIAALIWTTLGSVVGALALYGIGGAIGRDRVRAVAAWLPLVKLDDLDRTEAWFARHGAKAVFFGRMIPIFRSLISVPAGVERMPLGPFLLLTTLGSALWNTVFVLAGYWLGDNWHVVEDSVGVYSKAVLAVVVLAMVVFLAVRIIRGRQNRRSAGASGVTRPDIPRPDLGRYDYHDHGPQGRSGRTGNHDFPPPRHRR